VVKHDAVDKAPAIDKSQNIAFIICVFGYFFFVFMLNNQLPLILETLKFNEALLGTLIACSGLGNILSGMASAALGKRYPMQGTLGELIIPGGLTAIGFGIISIALLYLRADIMAISFCCIFLIVGVFSARFSIATNIFMVKNFSSDIALVSSRVQAMQNIAILCAPLVGASILSNYTPVVLFAFAGVFGIVVFILSAISSRVKPSLY